MGTGNQDEAAGLARRVLAQGGARSHASRPQPLMGTPRSVCSAVGVTWRPASTPTKSDSVNPRGASGRDARRPRGGWLINRTENTAPKPVLSSAAAPPGRGEPGTRRCLRTRLHKADFCKTLGKRVPRVRTRLSSSQSSYIQPNPPPSSQAQRSPPSLLRVYRTTPSPGETGGRRKGRETLPGGEALESSSGSPRGCFLSQFYLEIHRRAPEWKGPRTASQRTRPGKRGDLAACQ